MYNKTSHNHVPDSAKILSPPAPNLDGRCSITITATAKTTGLTGVEMEAMMAASVAALTIYDMCKAVDREMSFSEVCLLSKSGGKSGTYIRKA